MTGEQAEEIPNGTESSSLPINFAPFLHADLDDSASRYDRLVAAPSEQEIHIMWSIWLILTLLVTLFVLVVFLAILVNRSVRKSSFNEYLLFLMIPDLLMSSMCVVTCALNLSAGHYHSVAMCHFQSFYLIFGIGANAWLNAVIARELHKMLRFSNIRQRYFPPKHRTVWLQSATVFIWSSFVALWPYLDKWIPHKTALQSGMACVPVEYSRASTLFFFCAFMPCFAILPLLYVMGIAIDVVRRGLIPRSGKTRALAIYFFRLIFVFCIMWLPSLIFLFVVGGWVNPWVQWAAGAWSHLQGAASAAVSIMKPDINKAVRSLLTCHWEPEDDSPSLERASSSRMRLSVMFGSMRSSSVRSMIRTPPVSVLSKNSACSTDAPHGHHVLGKRDRVQSNQIDAEQAIVTEDVPVDDSAVATGVVADDEKHNDSNGTLPTIASYQ